jgi:precorrin-6B methylase 2
MDNKPDLDFRQKVDVAEKRIAAKLGITPEQVAVALGECTSPACALAAAAKDHYAYATDNDQEARERFRQAMDSCYGVVSR